MEAFDKKMEELRTSSTSDKTNQALKEDSASKTPAEKKEDFKKFCDEYKEKNGKAQNPDKLMDEFRKSRFADEYGKQGGDPQDADKAYGSKGDISSLKGDDFRNEIKERIEAETGKEAAKNEINSETARLSASGKSPEATIQNAQNIENAVKPGFEQRFREQNGIPEGQKLSDEQQKKVDKEYNDAFLKAFVDQKYGHIPNFNSLAGIDGDKVDPAFKTKEVSEMMKSFPDEASFNNLDGRTTEKASIPHLLSMIQHETTSADSLGLSIVKGVGNGIQTSNIAESMKKIPTMLSSITDSIIPMKEEPGHTGLIAGLSPDLQAAFNRSAVDGLREFYNNAQQHVDNFQNNDFIQLP